MVSVVGVSPLPASALPTSNLPPPAAAGADPRAAGAGERAASGRGAETADRIEASRQPDRTLKQRDEERRSDAPPAPAVDRPPLATFFAPTAEAGPQLLPPDRSAPTGPPPAFDRSPLEAERELRIDPADTAIGTPPADDIPAPAVAPDDAAEPVQTDAPEPEPERELAQADVPPSADERAQTEFTSVRRMETPYDTATVDVTR